MPLYLLKQVRQALPSRFGVTIRFYIAAALLLPLGCDFRCDDCLRT